MPYQPTGRPTGRPRNDGTPARGPVKPLTPKPEPPKASAKPVAKPKPEAVPEPEAARPEPGMSRPGPFGICVTCYPQGWPAGATGLACQHGIWSRPWMG